MAATDKTRIPKPSPIVEDEHGELRARKGISREVVEELSNIKGEPDWMRAKRLRSLEIFERKPIPTWGVDLSELNFDDLVLYAPPTTGRFDSWDDVPDEMKQTYEDLGIPQAEREHLAGVVGVWRQEPVYEGLKEEYAKQGILFCSMDTAIQQYPDLVQKYFMTKCVPPQDNKFSALHGAVWSGGAFVYIPKGVTCDLPLQAYFRMEGAGEGTFEHTLIIADEGSNVNYIEGCHPAGEQVVVGDRWVNIESLKPGDSVVGDDGEKHEVLAAMRRHHKGKMITITPLSKYNAFKLTPNHPVKVVPRETVANSRGRNGWLPQISNKRLLEAEPEYIPAGEVKKGDFLVFPRVRPTTSAPYSEDVLRLLGYYLAEGSTFIHKTLNQPVVSFSFSTDEAELIDEVCALIEKITGKNASVVRDKRANGVNITVYSQQLRDLCLEACGKGAATKQLSPALAECEFDELRPLFDAYFAGDGSVLMRPGNAEPLHRVCTASETLARQLQEILARGGIFASIQLRKGSEDTVLGRPITRGDQFILTYTPTRTKGEVRITDDYYLVPVKDVAAEDYDDLVFNIEVDGVNSYLARGFAVHNCTAQTYSVNSMHSAVVEIFVHEGAKARYTTVQNWSKDVYNLNTKRAVVDAEGTVEWVGGSMGAKYVMLYPGSFLMGEGARADHLNVGVAGEGVHKDTGAKVVHLAPNTTSNILAKSISKDGGIMGYRGLVRMGHDSRGSKARVQCDGLMMDGLSRSDTWPDIQIQNPHVTVAHEATVGRISDEQLFYMQSRGFTEDEAAAMIVNGFIEPVTKELPMEYAVELNRLIQLEMVGSIG
jgi:Fe-S cluster assembly protein SufB